MKKSYFFLMVLIPFFSKGQSITISPNNGSSIIESSGNNKAIKLPTVNATSAISSPQKGMVVFDDATGTMSYFNGSSWIPLSNSASGWAVSGNKLNSTNSGNVGIGEANPSAKLHVKTGESGATVPAFTNSVFENDNHNLISILSPDNKQSGIVMQRPSSSAVILYNEDESMTLHAGGSAKMSIESNGNVGIGTTSPTSKIHILNGNSGVTPNSSPDVLIEDDDHSYLNLVTPANRESGVLFGLPSNGTSGGIVYNNAGKKAMQFRTDNNTNQMTIDSTGKMILRTGEIQAGNHLLRLNNNGLFSSYNSSLNLIPIGIGKIHFTYDDTKSSTNYMTNKVEKIHGLAISNIDYFSGRANLGCLMNHDINIELDNAIVSQFDDLIAIVPTRWDHEGANPIIEYDLDSSPKVRIRYSINFCGKADVQISFLIYGIKN